MVYDSQKLVLDYITDNPQGVRIDEIVEHTGLSKTQVYRILNTIEEIQSKKIEKNKSFYITYYYPVGGTDEQ